MNENKEGKDIIPLEKGIQLFARKNGVESFPDIAPLLNKIIEKVNYLAREGRRDSEIVRKIAFARAKLDTARSKALLSDDNSADD